MQSMRSLVQVLCFFTVVLARAGEFKNLTFDEGLPIDLRPVFRYGQLTSTGDASLLFKEWAINGDGSPITTVYYDRAVIGEKVTLVDNSERIRESYGRFSLGVWGTQDVKDSQPIPIQITLSQTGMVPSDAIGLRYFSGFAGVQILANGALINTQDSYADLSKFAGTEVKLEIRFPKSYVGTFDILGFTTVPEPSEFAMLGLGLGIIGWQAWKRQRAHLPSVRNGGGRGSTHAPSTSADPV